MRFFAFHFISMEFILIAIGILALFVFVLVKRNRKPKSREKEAELKLRYEQFKIEKEKKERVQKEKLISRKPNSILKLQQAKYNQYEISSTIIKMFDDLNYHIEIGDTLDDIEIKKIESRLGFELPKSYKTFLKYFGDGGEWIYANNVDSIKEYVFLKDYREDLGNSIELVGEREVKVDTLLCLMTEDSNGGAWVWLTDEEKKDNEWSLAYYSLQLKQLFYKVENFTEWLKILVECKNEVITELDKDFILELG